MTDARRPFWATFRSDLYRYSGDVSWPTFLRHWFMTPGVRYSFYLRLCQWLKTTPARGLGAFYLVKYVMIRHGFRVGIDIPESTDVGEGLYIGHYGTIIVNGRARIGTNCNISHGVTIGQQNRGRRQGCPTIGDRVFIGPGAKILGNVQVGDGAAIGANCVVTSDVPAGGVVVGIPARLTSMQGSHGYMNHTVTEGAPTPRSLRRLPAPPDITRSRPARHARP